MRGDKQDKLRRGEERRRAFCCVRRSAGRPPGNPAKVCCRCLPARRSWGLLERTSHRFIAVDSSQPQEPMPRCLASNPTILQCMSVMKEEASSLWLERSWIPLRAERSPFGFEAASHKSARAHRSFLRSSR